MFKKILAVLAGVFVTGLAAVTVSVEFASPYRSESLGGAGQKRALVLYHPSRDAHFSEELSLAVAAGFKAAGLSVERATMSNRTPADPQGYAIIAVVSNTYFWTPDLPTLRYLKRATLDSVPAIGVIGGAGSTGRSQRLLAAALRRTGARVLDTRSFWILRPNDESRIHEPNRAVARDEARAFATRSAQSVIATGDASAELAPCRGDGAVSTLRPGVK